MIQNQKALGWELFISYLRIENGIRKGNFIDQATNPIHCNKKFRFPEVPLF